ncbi:MAG: UDP-glucose 4-epimerase [Candidatus Binatota bacterium]|nr:UDP-glucose 4-epimerase [Candidatus Binatota bacterium]
MERLLITGISSGQGRLLASRVGGDCEITGVDVVPWEGHPKNIEVHTVDLLKRKFEDIFRQVKPDAIVHLGLIRHFRSDPRRRHEVNVLGSKRVLECAARYGAKQLVVLTSSYVYGALPENPYFLDEDSPLNASRTYPEIRDLAELDGLLTTHLWQHPDMATVILRPVNTLGSHVRSAIGSYLKLGYVPTILGFNPMTQFIHEEDLTEAIALALEKKLRGIFNVTGPGEVPIKLAITETGNTPVPLPEFVARGVFGRLFDLGLFHVPPGAIDFIKYPCTVSGKRFLAATGFKPLFTLDETFASIR